MLPEAQKGRAFYAKAEDQFCEPGIFLTGHGELEPIAAGGRIGPPFESMATSAQTGGSTTISIASRPAPSFAPVLPPWTS